MWTRSQNIPIFGSIQSLEKNVWFSDCLEMIHSTGDIYENDVLQHLLPFAISKIFHFSHQKLVLR